MQAKDAAGKNRAVGDYDVSEREKTLFLGGMGVAALLLILGCSERQVTVERSVRIMGEPATVHATADEESVFAAAQTVRAYTVAPLHIGRNGALHYLFAREKINEAGDLREDGLH